jgi:hypothetical protein
MVIYGVYENDEYQECRFVGTAKEIAEEFRMTDESFRSGFCRNNRIKHKYIVKRICTEKEINQ